MTPRCLDHRARLLLSLSLAHAFSVTELRAQPPGVATSHAASAVMTDGGLVPAPGTAQPSGTAPALGAPQAPGTATAGSGSDTTSTPLCEEHLPEGKARPQLVEQFPAHGTSGHHAVLEVRIEHGSGERVLPVALQVNSESDAVDALERAGFVLPHWKGPGRPRITREERNGAVTSTVQLSFVPLPKEPGRHALTLPPVPIAMARASGEVITLCTQAHSIVVEDAIANVPNPTPKGNPEPLRQREFWSALRNIVYGGMAAVVLFVLAYLLARWYQRRPKPTPPPPPPRPPWEVALESFRDIRYAQLIEQQRYQEHFDRVTHTLRQYLGDRFGFDGLESTTTEIMAHLSSHPDASPVLQEVKLFMQESDLVRFADVEPTEAQCRGILDRSEQVVQSSIPTLAAPVSPPPASSNRAEEAP